MEMGGEILNTLQSRVPLLFDATEYLGRATISEG